MTIRNCIDCQAPFPHMKHSVAIRCGSCQQVRRKQQAVEYNKRYYKRRKLTGRKPVGNMSASAKSAAVRQASDYELDQKAAEWLYQQDWRARA